jgi:hypothetical protein
MGFSVSITTRTASIIVIENLKASKSYITVLFTNNNRLQYSYIIHIVLYRTSLHNTIVHNTQHNCTHTPHVLFSIEKQPSCAYDHQLLISHVCVCVCVCVMIQYVQCTEMSFDIGLVENSQREHLDFLSID